MLPELCRYRGAVDDAPFQAVFGAHSDVDDGVARAVGILYVFATAAHDRQRRPVMLLIEPGSSTLSARSPICRWIWMARDPFRYCANGERATNNSLRAANKCRTMLLCLPQCWSHGRPDQADHSLAAFSVGDFLSTLPLFACSRG